MYFGHGQLPDKCASCATLLKCCRLNAPHAPSCHFPSWGKRCQVARQEHHCLTTLAKSTLQACGSRFAHGTTGGLGGHGG